MLICDTSGLLAAADRAAKEHAACRELLAAHAGRLVVSPYVVAELDHLVRARIGHAAARVLARSLTSPTFVLDDIDAVALQACLDVDERYADLQLGVADASLVVLAERHGTTRLLTLDADFRAVRPAQGGAFTILPADR